MTVLDEDMSECCSSEISYFIDEVKLYKMEYIKKIKYFVILHSLHLN